MQESVERRYIEEDEIDLRELFKTIWDRKLLIAIVTGTITILAIVYAFYKTPIYEVKSNVQVGFITNVDNGKLIQELIANPGTLVKVLNVVFNVEDKVVKKDKKFVSEVKSITTNKKLKNFIEIKTEGISSDEALKKNREVVKYAQNMTKAKIEQYIKSEKNSIKSIELNIQNLEAFDKVNIKREIEKLKIVNIAKIDEKIKFYEIIKIPTLNKKIKFYETKLKEYTEGIKDIYSNSNNSVSSAIASMQMVNYQNLILNAQNRIEDLKLEIEKIENELIINLKREKEVIKKDSLRKLEYQLQTTLPNKKIKLKEQIENLKFQMSSSSIQNSKVVGEYIVSDNPIKPKKKLIVVVAFVTGFILSIFLVFFLEFIRGFKEEDKA